MDHARPNALNTTLTRTPPRSTLSVVIALLLGVIGGTGVHLAAASPAPAKPTLQDYARLPLQFETNQGQAHPSVKYLSRGAGYTFYLTPTATVLTLHQTVADNPSSQVPGAQPPTPAVIRMELSGANKNAELTGDQPLPGKVNYLIGRDPAEWHRGIATYRAVRAAKVYPGIDLRYHGDQRALEYDFIVAPGAEPDEIRLAFTGVEALTINGQGELILKTSAGELRHKQPVMYQEIDGRREMVEGSYKLSREESLPLPPGEGRGEGGFLVGFTIAAYDKNHPLVIDPVLDYATYLGGEQADHGLAIAVDDAGSAYVAGTTFSTTFPTDNPLQGDLAGTQDAFIAKLTPAGDALIYATYFGGPGDEGVEDEDDLEDEAGEDDEDDNDEGDADIDTGLAIAVDAAGAVYFIGTTASAAGFPIVNALQQNYGGGASDAFVAILTPDGGGLAFSTYLGGGQQDLGFGLALDPDGNVYVTGKTRSSNFPVLNAAQSTLAGNGDAFVAKLAPDGAALLYSTYLGGSKADVGKAIAVDANGGAYITGVTQSKTNFPRVQALQPAFGGGGRDAFVTKLTPAGNALAYSTYLGGSKKDKGRGIAVDGQGHAVVVGHTKSNDFPAANALQPAYGGGGDDGFIGKFAPDGAAWVFSTYLGGAKTDRLRGVAVDNAGRIYVTGNTKSPSGIPMVDAIQANLRGDKRDALITGLSADGQAVLFSTYLGGGKNDSGQAIAVGADGAVYVTGVTKSDLDFPVVNALQPFFGGGAKDAFVVKIGPDNLPPVITSTPVTEAATLQAYTYQVTATNPDGDELTFSLDGFPDGMTIDAATGLIAWTPAAHQTGEHEVTVTVEDGRGGQDSQSYTITVIPSDTTGPVIVVTAPAEGTVTNASSITVTGTLSEPATLTVAGQPVTVELDLTFSTVLSLNEGINSVSLTAVDAAGNVGGAVLTITSDTITPVITVTAPADDSSANQADITVSGNLSEAAAFTINGLSVTVNPDLTFNHPLTMDEGPNAIALLATDAAGNNAVVELNVTLDTSVPVLTLTAPAADTLTNNPAVTFSGGVSEPVTLTIAGQPVPQAPDNSFSAVITLNEGLNAVAVIAADNAGNADTVTVNVTVDSTPPAAPDLTRITRGNPNTGIVSINGNPGALEAGTLAYIVNTVSGVIAWQLAQTDGSFTTAIAAYANDNLEIYAIDAAGNRGASGILQPATPPALTLNAIGDKIAPLGQITRFTVTANDSAGNPITLGLTPLPLPDHMEYDISTGEFSFQPDAGQAGDYTLIFSALTGDERVTEAIQLTVPPANPADPTVFTGRILDATGMQDGGIIPIVGATIRFLETGFTTVTDNEGYFTLTNLPATATVFDINGSTAQPGPGGALYASFREGLPIISNVANQVERPFYMPRLATESLTTVIPNQTTVVTNPTLGITLTVPPNTAINDSDGTPFTGQLSISLVPREFAPANLPEFMDPERLITIQPVGVSYVSPVPITFPNSENLEPETEVDLWSVDPDLGQFVVVGTGKVSADGQVIETIGGGIRANDWHAPLPRRPDNPVTPKPVDQDNPCSCPKQPMNSQVTLNDGRLSEQVTLPAYRSLESSRSLTFIYETNRAYPKPVLPFNTGIQAGFTAIPPTLSYQLSVAGLKQGAETFVSTQGLVRGQAARSAIAFSGAEFKTGMYRYALTITSNYTRSRISNIVSGEVMVVNEQASPFGAGWLLDGHYRLAFNEIDGVIDANVEDDSVLLVSPEGRPIHYRPSGAPGEYNAPDNDYAVFQRNPDGSYTHTEKDGTRMQFNAGGQHTATVDRHGNTTSYTYDTAGKLITVTDPAGLITTFAYDLNGRLASVTDPAGRVTTFTQDATGNLTKVLYPDGSFKTFEYDGRHLLTADTDERGQRSTARYDNFGRILDATLPDGTVRAAASQSSAGLIDTAGGSGTPTTPGTLVQAADAAGRYVDGRGNASRQTLDAHGRATLEVDEVGRTTSHQRDLDSNPTRTTRPNGSQINRTFDTFGNVLSQTESFNGATTSYTYDGFSRVTSVTNPRNHTTTITRDPVTGNPLQIVNALGHTTSMAYDARGLVTEMTSPNGLVTTYSYNAQGLMATKTETPVAGNVRVTQYAYFPTGLLQQVITPDGITLTYSYDERSRLLTVTDNLNQSIHYDYDEYGNVTRTETTNSDGSLALLVEAVYDTRNRLTETQAPHGTTEQSITQRLLDENDNLTGLIDPNGNPSGNVYDASNRLSANTHRENGITQYQYDTEDRIVKVIAPNGAETRYEYDVLGRRTKEISPDRGTLTYGYDLANNVTSITDGRGITAAMTYDELERVKTKSYPTVTENVTYTYDMHILAQRERPFWSIVNTDSDGT